MEKEVLVKISSPCLEAAFESSCLVGLSTRFSYIRYLAEGKSIVLSLASELLCSNIELEKG